MTGVTGVDRAELRQHILTAYGVEPVRLWARYPGYEVFRRGGSERWFALVMELPAARLGLSGNGVLDVVNLKCDPILGQSLRQEPGFFPAYHMNKEHWITAALDGSVPKETLCVLLEMSVRATAAGPKRRK